MPRYLCIPFHGQPPLPKSSLSIFTSFPWFGSCVCSGVMANQLAVMAHLINNGNAPTMFQNVICDARSHVHAYENGGIAINARAQTSPLTPANGKYLTADEVEKGLQLVKDWHHPVTTLVCLENTLGGVV